MFENESQREEFLCFANFFEESFSYSNRHIQVLRYMNKEKPVLDFSKAPLRCIRKTIVPMESIEKTISVMTKDIFSDIDAIIKDISDSEMKTFALSIFISDEKMNVRKEGKDGIVSCLNYFKVSIAEGLLARQSLDQILDEWGGLKLSGVTKDKTVMEFILGTQDGKGAMQKITNLVAEYRQQSHFTPAW